MRHSDPQLHPQPQQELARLLARAGGDGLRFADLPAALLPRDADAAYAVQAEVLRQRGAGIGGWKVGAKSATGPVQGAPLPADCVHASPAALKSGSFRRPGLELEIAFRFGRVFAPRAAPYADEEVLDGIEYMAAAIEVVASRYREWPAVDKLAQLADLQNHGALVVGDCVRYQPGYPFLHPALSFTFGGAGVDVVAGAPANPAGDPRRLLPWLVNHCTARGITLGHGTLVTTGSYTGMHFPAQAGVALGTIAGLPPVALTLG
ncbi:2-keto-4-pentenoate hydratase [Cupriavidus basilensis]|uniref:2-keto-4-pentenoate hydratase n=1 Tax=Cupriavidus basilensis TaxID=68895 RepID=UPI000750C189|nr:2-keto-4-pentenoate hydratase [Cupriavidus basilensis]